MEIGRKISYLGIAASAAGVILAVLFFVAMDGAIGSLHQAAGGQLDSGMIVLQEAGHIAEATAESVDSFSAFASNASVSVNRSADAISAMGDAVGLLANSLGSIPYMPGEATAPLRDAAAEMKGTAGYMRQTAESMAGVTGGAVSTAAGIGALKEEIEANVLSMQEMKGRLDGIAGTMRAALALGSLLAIMLFALNGLSFYRQL